MQKANLIKTIEVVLANTYALYLKSHVYHWNVRGEHFAALHGLFETHYTELALVVDEIAERLRALDQVVRASFTTFNNLKTVSDPKDTISSQEMLTDLVESHDAVHESLKACLKAAREADDFVTEDMMIERMAYHEKTVWMLKASLV